MKRKIGRVLLIKSKSVIVLLVLWFIYLFVWLYLTLPRTDEVELEREKIIFRCPVEHGEKPIGGVKFLLVPTNFDKNSTLDVIIIVKTSVYEFDERKAIRKTWGGQALELGMVVIFTVGLSKNDTVNKWVLSESLEYEDILQSNVKESYHNLVLKQYMTTLWTVNIMAKVLLFVDSDIIVFPKRLENLANMLVNNNNLIAGHLWINGRVARNITSKHCVPSTYYPKSTYPPYCTGAAYFMTGDVPLKLLNAIPNGPDNWQWAHEMGLIDDVVFSGILREAANVSLEEITGLYRGLPAHDWNPCKEYILSWYISEAICRYTGIFAILNSCRPANDFLEGWKKFNEEVEKCDS